MKWSSALRVPLENDLAEFLQLLKQQSIAHRVTEYSGEQVLWVSSAVQAAQVGELYQQFQRGEWGLAPVTDQTLSQRVAYQPAGFVEQLRRSPITAGVLLACLLVAVITHLGDNISTVSWFTFNDFRIQDEIGRASCRERV